MHETHVVVLTRYSCLQCKCCLCLDKYIKEMGALRRHHLMALQMPQKIHAAHYRRDRDSENNLLKSMVTWGSLIRALIFACINAAVNANNILKSVTYFSDTKEDIILDFKAPHNLNSCQLVHRFVYTLSFLSSFTDLFSVSCASSSQPEISFLVCFQPVSSPQC